VKKIKVFLLFLLFIFVLFFYYNIFLQKPIYDEKEITDQYQSILNDLLKFSGSNSSTLNYSIDTQFYIRQFLQSSNIYSIGKENGFLDEFKGNEIIFDNIPQINIVNKNNKIIKNYFYKKDFNIQIDQRSKPISKTIKPKILVDLASFNPQKEDLILISSVYYNEKYDNTFNEAEVLALITDEPKNFIEKDYNIFFNSYSKQNNQDEKKLKNNITKIYVTPEVYSELASYTFNNYLINIKFSWKTKECNLYQNTAFLPGKLKDELLIIQIPVSNNISTIASALSLIKFFSNDKNKLTNSVLFFFSDTLVSNFPAELNFINAFSKFPKNTRVLILENEPTNEPINENKNEDDNKFEIFSFLTKSTKNKIINLSNNVIKRIKKHKYIYTINYFDTDHRHFPYIYNKIPAISISSINTKIDVDNKDTKYNKFTIALLYGLISEIPYIFKFYFVIIIIVFLLFFIYILTKRTNENNEN